ncbi:hypothetical protein ACFPOH_07190 [Ureibacillus suwonensis]|uniref:Uncharacterized protein n=1 Tax=Ureibacillus suwonensis TaxID=313007 RepID=A0ABW0RBS9_9BACL
MFDPLGPFNRISAESNRKLEENLQKVRETLREREERETERNKLLKNINEDTKKILDGLINLEKIIQNNLNITEGNLIKMGIRISVLKRG